MHLCVSNSYKFPAEFPPAGAAPLFELVSIYCQICSLQLRWKKWNFCGATGSRSLGGVGINFPIGASEADSTLEDPHPSSFLSPPSVGVGAVVRFLRQKPLVAPTLFPSSPLEQLQEAEQSKSLTAAEKTLVWAGSQFHRSIIKRSKRVGPI